MARTLNPGAARSVTARAATSLAAAMAFAVTLGGCASTDALYAEYDERMCRVEIASAPPVIAAAEPVTVRALIEKSYFPWEPAVYFAFNSDVLDAENAARLEGALEVLARFGDVHVSLQGFTDRIGPNAYNAWLASRRVNSVRTYLVERGADPGRLVSQPLGEGLPVFGDDDAKARAVNRRVELMLLDTDGRPLHPLFDFDAIGERTPFQVPIGAALPSSPVETGVPATSGPFDPSVFVRPSSPDTGALESGVANARTSEKALVEPDSDGRGPLDDDALDGPPTDVPVW